MSDPMNPFSSEDAAPADTSFADLLSEFEQSHKRGGQRLEGTVVAVTADSVLFDVGFKTEGVVPLSECKTKVRVGDKCQVTMKGREPGGYYLLSLVHVEQPKDWSALERAFERKAPIAGVVTAVVKGGLAVDAGVRAFLPASRSGARDAAEMEKLVGQEIRCQIIKLDVADEDLVVDRRVVLEREEQAAREQLVSGLREGAVVRGTVRSLADYGAFVDIGGVDGLLHVADISWSRVGKPADVLSVGDEIEVQILKIDSAKKRIGLGMKQLQPEPWTLAGEKFKAGDRVRGVVTRVADFGAFVEIEPGIEGLIHVSELSWSKRVNKASDMLRAGETVEAVVLSVNTAERRIALGLKQALGDPWADAKERFKPGTIVEGPVTNLAPFGAFVQLAEGVEGMVHVGDMSAEKRINHPQEVVKTGQTVKAVVLEFDLEKRRIRLGMKQLQPTSIDEYIAEHKEGDVVTGRVADISRGRAKVELGEGIRAVCEIQEEAGAQAAGTAGADLSSLSSMLAAKWKGGAGSSQANKREPARAGQIRSFRIVKLVPGEKKIEIELAG
jgi:small subunit ribosomal protein S1